MKRFFSFMISAILTVVCCISIFVIGYVVFRTSSSYKWETAPAVELTDFGSPNKFYFNTLDNIEKHAYNEIITHVYDMPESIEIPRISIEQMDKIFSALLYDNPDLFFIGRKCTLSSQMLKTSCSIEYIINKEDYIVQKAQLEDMSDKIISSLTSPDDEWQTELEIHDYIVDNCKYKIVENELVYSSAYGALVNGVAACEGYSKAAKLLFDEAGIESAVLSGISNTYDEVTGKNVAGAHMWNAVKIYGDYYYLDCTWDDPHDSLHGDDIKTYFYFNVDTDTISLTHSDFSYDFGCTATAANYFIKTGRYFNDYNRSYESQISSLLADEINNGSWKLQLRFGNRAAFDAAVNDLFTNERFHNILVQAKRLTKKNFYSDRINWQPYYDHMVILLIPERQANNG